MTAPEARRLRQKEGRRRRQWKALYRQLQALCSRFGKEDAFGECDYWILDDDYGFEGHKICLWNIQLLNQTLASEIQSLLLRRFKDWTVTISVDVLDTDWPEMGLHIHSDRVEDGLIRDVLPPEIAALNFA